MSLRTRREPPRFRRIEVRRVEPRSARLVRVTFGGPELEGMAVPQAAASVRLLLPGPASDELIIPTWNGNEFFMPGGARPVIRTLTPRRFDANATELDVEIVIHGDGAASRWAQQATEGSLAAVSGPGRGYSIDPDAAGFLLVGDETAIPAISQLLEVLQLRVQVDVHLLVASGDARVELPERPDASLSWHAYQADQNSHEEAIVDVLKSAPFGPDVKVWIAGEAAAVQRSRRHLFEELGIPRSQASVRGYWKKGKTADADVGDN